jgi:hypothetical protein
MFTAAVIIFFIAALYILTVRDPLGKEKKDPISVVILSMGIFLALSLSFYEFVVDDVYISLRYARNLAHGHGLVFSTDGSAPVEGYTNFLWVLLQSPLFLLNLNDDSILHIVKFIGIVFGLGILFLTYRMIGTLTGNNTIAATGVLFLSTIPELALWAVGGLETSLYIFLLVGGVYRYILEKRKKKPHTLSMILFALMAFTRPEGVFYFAAFLGFDLVQTYLTRNVDPEATTKSLMRITKGALLFGSIYFVYFLWRYNFYGHPFPNTFYAKKIAYSQQMLHRAKQVSSFMIQLFPIFSIACLSLTSKSHIRERSILFLSIGVLIGFCFIARNEWMPGYRYELPFVPFLMVLFAIGASQIPGIDITQTSVGWRPRIMRFAFLFFLGIFLIYPFNDLRKESDSFSQQLRRAHIPLGAWFKKHAPPDASYASWDMGAVPYFSGFSKIIDINSEGLLNTYTTFKGYNVDYLISQSPSFLVLPPNTSYVRPRDILDFYTHEKLNRDYEFLFSVYFTKDYLLNVYKHRDVKIDDAAIQEGRQLSQKSMLLAVN